MKAFPPVVACPAPEATPPPPEPARLGMLRFERPNEAGWRMLYLDPAHENEFGFAPGQLCLTEGATFGLLMAEADRQRLHADIQQQLASQARYQVRYCLQGPGSALEVLEVGERHRSDDDLLSGFLLKCRTGTLPAGLPREASTPLGHLAVPHALHLFQRAVEQTASAFLLIDREGWIEYANPSFTAITHYTVDEVKGRHLSELPALAHLAAVLHDDAPPLAGNGRWQGEFHSQRKNLESYWGRLSVSRIFDEHNLLTHYLVIYEDITESKLTQQRVERLACTDHLTGLVNRSYFILNLEQRCNRAQGPQLALLLVDLDNFKRINDSLGHRVGDQLLITLAKRLRQTLDGRSVVARIASNEFAVLLDGMALDESLHLTQQVLQALDQPLYIDNRLIGISVSAGLACAPLHGNDPQTLMRHAGLALHKAKANGKHQLQVFTETLNAEADFRLFLESSLRKALSQHELDVVYQPKLCLRTGCPLGLEALLRWHHPEKGPIRPDQFIGVAEETGLIIPIGEWVARQACRMAVQLSRQGLGNLHMAINLSPRQFADTHLVQSLSDILRQEGLEPERLELELTESVLLDATDMTRRQLSELKRLGVTLAMDDFGTGYSSLSYLKKFPIDVIKIDRSFIKDIPASQNDMEITSAVIAMARSLRMQVVAEGIETLQQLDFLRQHRCDIGQGYLFDKPLPAGELVQRLRGYPAAD